MKKHYFTVIFSAILCFLVINSGGNFSQIIKTQVLRQEPHYPLFQQYKYEIIEKENEMIRLEPGEENILNLTIKNTGKTAWNLKEGHKNQLMLGTYFPRYRISPFLDRMKIPIEDKDGKKIIEPNDTTTFEFKIKAPPTPGFYHENFLPLVSNIKWINNEKLSWDFLVGEDFEKGYRYEIIEKESQTTIPINSTKTIELKVKNTGKVPWYNDGPHPFTLITEDESTAMREMEVQPGQTASFSFDLKPRSTAGSFNLNFKLALKDLYIMEENLPWNIEIADKMVALTFDDGYGDIDGFLDVLREENVRGTFFMLGVVAEANPEKMQKIISEGHLLANHSYDHPDFRTLSADSIRWQVAKAREIMKEATGLDVYPYFRYPYGAHNNSTDQILAENGWQYFHWTNGTGDWKFHPNTAHGRQHVYYFATLNPKDRTIILMHIISKSTLAVLPDIIDFYRDKGYAFVTVDEL